VIDLLLGCAGWPVARGVGRPGLPHPSRIHEEDRALTTGNDRAVGQWLTGILQYTCRSARMDAFARGVRGVGSRKATAVRPGLHASICFEHALSAMLRPRLAVSSAAAARFPLLFHLLKPDGPLPPASVLGSEPPTLGPAKK